jgi:geranylgeranyl pyrophosphate synthase
VECYYSHLSVTISEITSSIMTPAAFIQIIDKKLDELFEREVKSAATPEVSLLLTRIKLLILAGGKRFRPYLTYLTYKSYGGSNEDEVLNVSLSAELLHSYLLIHDDIIDEDLKRYEVPNIGGEYLADFTELSTYREKLHMANAMALIAGDLVQSLAYKTILDSSTLNAAQKNKLLTLLTISNMKVLAGQQLDTLNIAPLLPDYNHEKLIKTNLLKSSSYSTILPMKIAASLLALDISECKKIEHFADNLGILYQLVDDYSDYFTNHTMFDKKPKFRDYRQGKITHPYFVALQRANSQQLMTIQAEFGNKNAGNQYIKQVCELLEELGAKQEAQSLIQEFAEKSRLSLRQLSIGKDDIAVFQKLIGSYNSL